MVGYIHDVFVESNLLQSIIFQQNRSGEYLSAEFSTCYMLGHQDTILNLWASDLGGLTILYKTFRSCRETSAGVRFLRTREMTSLLRAAPHAMITPIPAHIAFMDHGMPGMPIVHLHTMCTPAGGGLCNGSTRYLN